MLFAFALLMIDTYIQSGDCAEDHQEDEGIALASPDTYIIFSYILKGDHYEDYKAANAASGRTGAKPPKGYTWHHMEDGQHMQLVDKNIHREFPHTGGASTARNK